MVTPSPPSARWPRTPRRDRVVALAVVADGRAQSAGAVVGDRAKAPWTACAYDADVRQCYSNGAPVRQGIRACLGPQQSPPFPVYAWSPEMTTRDDSPFSTVAALRERSDEAATRELVAFLEHDQPSVRLEAARAIFPRHLPMDLRAHVGAYLRYAPEDLPPEVEDQLLRWLYSCAAKAVLEAPPERAFAEMAPLLEASALESKAGRLRAEQIFLQLEEKLAWCWKARVRQHDAALPDPRFLAVCESVCASSDGESIRFLTHLVIDGFRFLEGKAIEPVFKHVELGEDGDVPFPFLIAGFVLRQEDPIASVERDRWVPASVCCFYHQFGGLGCLHETLVGYGVAVPPNLQDSEPLRRLREAWFESQGEPITHPELQEWHKALGGPESFPPLERGNEALLVSHECEPVKALRDLRVLSFGSANAPWRPRIDLSVDPDVSIGGAYTETHDAALLRLGGALGLGRPRIIYLWGNSD
jgi:hypothetical protein